MLGFLFGYGLLHDTVRLYGNTIWHSGEGNWDSDGTYKDMDGSLRWGGNRKLCTYRENKYNERIIGSFSSDVEYRNFIDELRMVRMHNAILSKDRTTFLYDEYGNRIKQYYPDLHKRVPLYKDLMTGDLYCIMCYERVHMYVRIKDMEMIRPTDGTLLKDKMKGEFNYTKYLEMLVYFNNNKEKLYKSCFGRYKSLQEKILNLETFFYSDTCFDEGAPYEKFLTYKEYKELKPVYYKELTDYREEYKRKVANKEIIDFWK